MMQDGPKLSLGGWVVPLGFFLMADDTINNHAAFIWSVADVLAGDQRPFKYELVNLPVTSSRRLKQMLDLERDR